MLFIPNGNRVLIKPEEAQDKSPGGILLPDQAKEKPRRGKIVANGIGKRESDGNIYPIPFDEGSVVYYSSYSGNKIEFDRDEFLCLDADDVLGVLVSK